MKMKRWIRKVVPIVSAVMIMMFTSIDVYADGNISGDGSLTIDVRNGDEGISGAEFTIYKVQHWTETGADQDLEWSGAFEDFGNQNIGSLRGQSAKFLKEAAESLEAYINGDDTVSSYKTGTSGTNGVAAFSKLEPGVYLVVVTKQPDGYTVTSPFLAFVPRVDKNGDVHYNVSVEAKIEEAPMPTATPTAAPTATPTAAPTATPGPSATPGPTGTPTPRPTAPPPATPGPTGAPTPGPTDTPPEPTAPATPAPQSPTDAPSQPTDQPQITNNSPNPTPTPDQAVLGMRRRRGWEKGVLGRRRLPQTGTLQWPIPVLAGAGVLLFFIGWMRKYGKKNKREGEKKGRGMLLMSFGPLMIIGGMGILFYNNWDNARAERAAENVLAQIEQNARQEEAAEDLQAELNMLLEGTPEEVDTTMGTIEVDGFTYIGEVAIPAIDISLPVMNSVTSEGLKIAPGRYEGNYNENSLIIAAHNYQRHFGNIKYLAPGDQVVFLDVDGGEHFYEVAEIETVGGKKVSKMSEGEWDLTLFTCTYGGRNRVTVRCNLQEEA